MKDHEYFMKKAIKLAKKGKGFVNPNPLVGALIVKEGEILSEGYHEKYGEFHAERNALKNLKVSPKGSIMYVTLEPCSHHGKTPPCTDIIIESGISTVVIGSLDPNNLVSGVKVLKNAGINVISGVLKDECDTLNDIFFHYIKHKTPYVLMKYAMTLDGKIATTTGESKWISNEKSRKNAHKTRNRYMAIMVGVNTILKDDPMLDTRLLNSKNPIRIICDSNLKTPIDCKVLQSAKQIKTIIATINQDENLHKTYENLGVEIIKTSKRDGKVNLKELMKILGEKGIDSILLEGGATLNFSALDSEIVTKINAYIAPKIFGGEQAKSPVAGKGFSDVLNKICLKNQKVTKFYEDILIESEVFYVHRDN